MDRPSRLLRDASRGSAPTRASGPRHVTRAAAAAGALSEPARLRAQAEAAEARFQALVESAPDAIVTVNRAGLIVLVTSQAETLFGYARADLEGQPIELLVPERYHEQHAADRQRYTAAPTHGRRSRAHGAAAGR
jgi:PAS domain-containing protein